MARLLGGDDSDSPDEEEERPRRSGVFRRRQRRRRGPPAPRRSASLAAVGVPAVLVVTAVTALWISRTKRVELPPPPRPGDDFTGDPPSEAQGANSIFDTDISTLEVLRRHATALGQL